MCAYVILAETCLQSYPSKKLDYIDVYIGSFLRHAPSRPGGSKYQVTFHTINAWISLGGSDATVVVGRRLSHFLLTL